MSLEFLMSEGMVVSKTTDSFGETDGIDGGRDGARWTGRQLRWLRADAAAASMVKEKVSSAGSFVEELFLFAFCVWFGGDSGGAMQGCP